MKRRNLCKAKKLMTVVLSASMVMGSVVPAMAGGDFAFDVTATNSDNKSKNTENVTASLEDGFAGGARAEATDNSKATATIENDVTATLESDKGSTWGASASASDNSKAEVDIGNDLTVSGGSSADGITASSGSYSDNKDNSEVLVTVGGGVSVDSSDTSNGVTATARGNSKTEVDIGSELTVSGGSSADGITASSESYSDNKDNSEVLVTVGGDVSVNSSGYSHGVYATANGNSKTEVDIGNDLTVSGGNNSTAIGTGAYGSSSVDVTIKGDVTITGEEVTGISANASGDSSVNIKIGHNLTVEGDGLAIGAYATSDDSSVTVSVGGDVTSSGGKSIYGFGNSDITIGGDVVNKNEDGTAISLYDASSADNTATLTVTVAKDVTSAGDAVTISKTSDKSSIDLVVEGTLTGKHAIVLDQVYTSTSEISEAPLSSTANLNITVWRIETTGDSGSLVEDAKPNTDDSLIKDYTQNSEAEKNINYILKVDPIATSIGGTLSFAGETDSHGFHTAHAGDTVFLELSIPSNYTVDSFYNVDDATDVKVLSSGGKYYIEVPRGGGVFVGVNLKKISGSGSSDSDSSDSSDDPWTVTNNSNSNKGVFSSEAFAGLTFQVTGADGTPIVLNVLDVLTPLEPISAFNNFTLGAPTYDLNNVLGAAIVDFNDLLATTAGDTVNVPVAANVTNGKYYIVYFSDGTSTTVQCTADGFLTIPFGKNTKGLTYMIYEAQTDSLMGLTPIQDIREIQEFQYQSDNSLKQIGSDSFKSAEGLWTPFLDQAGSGVLNLSLENSNER